MPIGTADGKYYESETDLLLDQAGLSPVKKEKPQEPTGTKPKQSKTEMSRNSDNLIDARDTIGLIKHTIQEELGKYFSHITSATGQVVFRDQILKGAKVDINEEGSVRKDSEFSLEVGSGLGGAVSRTKSEVGDSYDQMMKEFEIYRRYRDDESMAPLINPIGKALKDLSKAVAPNVTSLLKGEPAPPPSNPDVTPVGKIPSPADKRPLYALQEATDALSNFIGGPGKGMSTAIFAGVGAATAKKGGKIISEVLEAAGASRERIFDKTGWFRGHDNMWKFEIPDKDVDFKIIGGIGPETKDRTALLGNIMSHPELFKAYPQLKDVKIRFQEPTKEYGDNIGGWAERHTNTIVINEMPERTGKIPEHQRSAILHEIQHFVQGYENFAPGTNTVNSLDRILKLLSEMDVKEGSKSDKALIKLIDIIKENDSPEFRKDLARMLYARQAGEVEARNVQYRAEAGRRSKELEFVQRPKGWDFVEVAPESRMSKYPWESEDVPGALTQDFMEGRIKPPQTAE